ncbi:MAG: hypothetical protein AABZ64_10400, partial [Nitrospinota bacterium]
DAAGLCFGRVIHRAFDRSRYRIAEDYSRTLAVETELAILCDLTRSASRDALVRLIVEAEAGGQARAASLLRDAFR